MKNTHVTQGYLVASNKIDKNKVFQPVALYDADGNPFDFDGIVVPTPPSNGNYVLKSDDGVLGWVLDA